MASGRNKFYVCQHDFDNMVKSKDEECQYCCEDEQHYFCEYCADKLDSEKKENGERNMTISKENCPYCNGAKMTDFEILGYFRNKYRCSTNKELTKYIKQQQKIKGILDENKTGVCK